MGSQLRQTYRFLVRSLDEDYKSSRWGALQLDPLETVCGDGARDYTLPIGLILLKPPENNNSESKSRYDHLHCAAKSHKYQEKKKKRRSSLTRQQQTLGLVTLSTVGTSACLDT